MHSSKPWRPKLWQWLNFIMPKDTNMLYLAGHLILLMLLAGYKLQAQQPRIAGYVTEMNSGKKKVAGVVVKAGASTRTHPVISLGDGSFTLIFQDMVPGQHVRIQAEKAGWLVVNEKEMNTIIPNVTGGISHIIIICPAKKLEKLRKEYYKITDFYITREYKRQLDSLKRIKKDYRQEVMALNEKFMALRKQLDTIAGEYSRTNLDDVTEAERRAIEAFKAGNINESIRIRDSLQSGRKLREAIIEKQKNDSLQKALKQNSDRLGNIYNLKPAIKNPVCCTWSHRNTGSKTGLCCDARFNYPLIYIIKTRSGCDRRNGWILYYKLLSLNGIC